MDVSTTSRLSYGAVILAAGGSARLGRPKQLLEIAGQPLVARASVAALKAGAHPVIVVVGAQADRIRAALAGIPVTVATNPTWPEGMASSIRVGLQTLGAAAPRIDAVLLAVCDQPSFDSRVVDHLLKALQASGRSIAAARYAGRTGVPAVFRRDHFFALAALTGDKGARALLAERADHVVAVDLPTLEVDFDTPEDVARWMSRLPES